MEAPSTGTWNARATLVIVLAAILVVPGCSKKGGGRRDENVREELTVIFSSDLLGKIRSCGCTVEDNGGLGRRASYIEDVRGSVANLLVLDAGDAFASEYSYGEKAAELTFDVYELYGLDVFTPGELEFVFGIDFLKELADRVTFPVVAANVVDPETGDPILGPPYVVLRLEKGVTVAVTGVLDDSIRFPGYIDASRFAVRPYEETLRRIVPMMKREARFLILLSHLGLERSRTLAESFGDFDIIITGHGKPITKQIEKIGETLVVAAGGLGQYIGRLDLTVSDSGDWQLLRLKIEALTDDIPIHEEVKRMFIHYGLPLTDKEMK
jgi:2',3'-cyclic-nucleotide 2'-phosphodiesterase (5'-nucleotidase family)